MHGQEQNVLHNYQHCGLKVLLFLWKLISKDYRTKITSNYYYYCNKIKILIIISSSGHSVYLKNKIMPTKGLSIFIVAPCMLLGLFLLLQLMHNFTQFKNTNSHQYLKRHKVLLLGPLKMVVNVDRNM